MFDFTITPDSGEPFQVTAGSRDVLTWERTTKGASLATLASGMKIGDMYRIAHIASRRLGLFNGDLATFEESCEITEADETDEPDPTHPAP
jgi:hypothetical protein